MRIHGISGDTQHAVLLYIPLQVHRRHPRQGGCRALQGSVIMLVVIHGEIHIALQRCNGLPESRAGYKT